MTKMLRRQIGMLAAISWKAEAKEYSHYQFNQNATECKCAQIWLQNPKFVYQCAAIDVFPLVCVTFYILATCSLEFTSASSSLLFIKCFRNSHC